MTFVLAAFVKPAESSHNPRVRRRCSSSLAAAATALALSACGTSNESQGPGQSPPSDAGHLDGAIYLDASCLVEIDQPPLMSSFAHVPIGTVVDYDSNPPSSGPHYPIWAAFQAYTTPVPREYYVHDLEHGAIDFLYNCGSAGCPEVVATLQAASDSLPDDPLCAATGGPGVRVRTVITPDPLIPTKVAAAAWGWIYLADCADLPTLEQFAKAHYGQGREDLCSPGTTVF
jgi:Protein of unknown function (DUF3105)